MVILNFIPIFHTFYGFRAEVYEKKIEQGLRELRTNDHSIRPGRNATDAAAAAHSNEVCTLCVVRCKPSEPRRLEKFIPTNRLLTP